jgi:hypothetical protein
VNVAPYEEGLNYIVLAEKLIDRGFKPYVVNLHAQEAVTATNIEFLQAGATTALSVIFGGSYGKVDVVSASTDDKSAVSDGNVRQVDFWGIDSVNNLVLEQQSLSGTTAISSTNSFKEMNDMAASAWGTESAGVHDAKGNIDLGATGKVTNECFRIPANANNILTSRLWVPKNWRMRIVHMHVNPGDNSAARSSGILIFPKYWREDQTEEDSTHRTAAIFHEGLTFDHTVFPKTYGNDTTMSRLSFFGERINASDTWNLHATVLIWATHSITSSQTADIKGLG